MAKVYEFKSKETGNLEEVTSVIDNIIEEGVLESGVREEGIYWTIIGCDKEIYIPMVTEVQTRLSELWQDYNWTVKCKSYVLDNGMVAIITGVSDPKHITELYDMDQTAYRSIGEFGMIIDYDHDPVGYLTSILWQGITKCHEEEVFSWFNIGLSGDDDDIALLRRLRQIVIDEGLCPIIVKADKKEEYDVYYIGMCRQGYQIKLIEDMNIPEGSDCIGGK